MPNFLSLTTLDQLMVKVPQEDSAHCFPQALILPQPRPPYPRVVSIFPRVAEEELENPSSGGDLYTARYTSAFISPERGRHWNCR